MFVTVTMRTLGRAPGSCGPSSMRLVGPRASAVDAVGDAITMSSRAVPSAGTTLGAVKERLTSAPAPLAPTKRCLGFCAMRRPSGDVNWRSSVGVNVAETMQRSPGASEPAAGSTRKASRSRILRVGLLVGSGGGRTTDHCTATGVTLWSWKLIVRSWPSRTAP